MDAVAKGEINIALVGPLPTEHDKIKSTVLFTEDIVALLSANHPLSNRSSLKLTELRDDSFVLFPEGVVLRDLVMKGCRQRGFQPNVSFEGKDLDAIRGLLSAVLSVSLLS